MKHLLLILVIFSFSFVAFGQKDIDFLNAKIKTFKSSRQYSVKYDKFKDESSVIYRGQGTGGLMMATSGKFIQLNLAFFFKTKVLNEDIEKYIFFFTATGKEWTFLKNRSLYVLADDKRLEFGEGERSSDISKSILGSYQTSEFLYFELPKDQLEMFANSKNLEMKVGGYELKIKDSEKIAFSNILELSKNLK